MGKIVLKRGHKPTSVTRLAIREAVAEAFKKEPGANVEKHTKGANKENTKKLVEKN